MSRITMFYHNHMISVFDHIFYLDYFFYIIERLNHNSSHVSTVSKNNILFCTVSNALIVSNARLGFESDRVARQRMGRCKGQSKKKAAKKASAEVKAYAGAATAAAMAKTPEMAATAAAMTPARCRAWC